MCGELMLHLHKYVVSISSRVGLKRNRDSSDDDKNVRRLDFSTCSVWERSNSIDIMTQVEQAARQAIERGLRSSFRTAVF